MRSACGDLGEFGVFEADSGEPDLAYRSDRRGQRIIPIPKQDKWGNSKIKMNKSVAKMR